MTPHQRGSSRQQSGGERKHCNPRASPRHVCACTQAHTRVLFPSSSSPLCRASLFSSHFWQSRQVPAMSYFWWYLKECTNSQQDIYVFPLGLASCFPMAINSSFERFEL